MSISNDYIMGCIYTKFADLSPPVQRSVAIECIERFGLRMTADQFITSGSIVCLLIYYDTVKQIVLASIGVRHIEKSLVHALHSQFIGDFVYEGGLLYRSPLCSTVEFARLLARFNEIIASSNDPMFLRTFCRVLETNSRAISFCARIVLPFIALLHFDEFTWRIYRCDWTRLETPREIKNNRM